MKPRLNNDRMMNQLPKYCRSLYCSLNCWLKGYYFTLRWPKHTKMIYLYIPVKSKEVSFFRNLTYKYSYFHIYFIGHFPHKLINQLVSGSRVKRNCLCAWTSVELAAFLPPCASPMHCVLSLCPAGKKVLVRCLKQVKPYAGKGVADDEDEDDDEDYANRALPLEGRIMETDVLTQAYHIGRFHCSAFSFTWRPHVSRFFFLFLFVGSQSDSHMRAKRK